MSQDLSSSPASGSGGPGHPPPTVPDHQMLQRIDQGSYGEVWLGRHVLLGAYRAVKVVYRDRFGEDRPFERELEGIRQFEPISRSHPSQVSIFQVGGSAEAGHFYYAMELADDQHTGQQIDPDHYQPRTLRNELKQRGRLPIAECLEIGCALATAVEYLHGVARIHRDIKPSNVIFVNGQPKLADIGLVAAAGEECSFVGTEGYVAPEGPGEKQADIYALGKVLYEMMTGLSPNPSSSLSPGEKYPSLPSGWAKEPDHQVLKELNEVVLRACEHDVKRRYQTAGELRLDLELLKSGKALPRFKKLQRVVQRQRVLIGALAGTTVLGVLGFGVWSYSAGAKLRVALLAQARIERRGTRTAGWYETNRALIERAAAIRSGPDILEQGASALAGLDATPLCVLSNVVGGSVAFGSDATLLVGGTRGSPALLITNLGTNFIRIELPLCAEGPVCWAADGEPLQFSASSNVCLLQEVRSGEIRQRFPLAQDERAVTNFHPVLAMSSDGSRVAAAVTNATRGRVVVWEAATGDFLGGTALDAQALAFSTDGTLLAAGDTNGNIAVFSLPRMTNVLDLPPPTRPAPVRCLAMTRDRVVRDGNLGNKTNWLVAASYKGGEVVIWDLQGGVHRARCRGSSYSVTCLAFHPNGLILASAGRDMEVRFWDVMSGDLLLRITNDCVSDARGLAFNSNGTRLAWSTENPPAPSADSAKSNLQDFREELPPEDACPSVAVWRLHAQRGVHVLHGLTTSVRWVWFSGDSRLVAALSDDWHVAVWEPLTNRLVNIFQVPIGAFPDCAGGAFDTNGTWFAFAAGTEARLYELGSGRVLEQWHRIGSGLMDHLQFDATGRLLFVRRGPDTEPATERRWHLYELAANSTVRSLREQGETNWVPFGVAFPPGGERFFVWTEGANGRLPVIRAYGVDSDRELWRVGMTRLVQPGVCLDPTGRWFAYRFGTTNRYQVVRVSHSDFAEFGRAPEGCLAIGPSGDQFAVKSGGGLMVCDGRGAKNGLPLGSDWTRSSVPCFSPDGTLLAWGTKEGVVLVADIEEVRRRLAQLQR